MTIVILTTAMPIFRSLLLSHNFCDFIAKTFDIEPGGPTVQNRTAAGTSWLPLHSVVDSSRLPLSPSDAWFGKDEGKMELTQLVHDSLREWWCFVFEVSAAS